MTEKEVAVATFVVLINWTEQGVKGYKDSASRADAARQAFQGLGVSLEEIWWTLGPYDIVSVIEAPDDETMTAAMLQLSSAGNIRTTTMRAFSRDEFSSLVGKTG